MGSKLLSAVRQKIVKEEGFRGSVYKDTQGNSTVGRGYNISDPTVASLIPLDVRNGLRPITQAEADAADKILLPRAQNDARNFLGPQTFDTLSLSQQQALIDVAYNLGATKLAEFKRMKKAFLVGDHKKAAAELLDSDYAKQVPNRAQRNANLLLQGAP